MSRTLSSEVFAALQARAVVARDFMWVIARDRDSGEAFADGLWSDVGQITVPIINPHTGGPVNRTFYGSGTLVQVSDIPLVQGVTVQTVTITLSQLNDRVNAFVRTYDCKQAEVQIFRGLFDPATRTIVAPAEPRFVGFIDEAPITTPREGEDGSISFTCTSNTQELTRANSDTRSDASQRLRSATDNFFQDVSVVSDWQLFWGKATA